MPCNQVSIIYFPHIEKDIIMSTYLISEKVLRDFNLKIKRDFKLI